MADLTLKTEDIKELEDTRKVGLAGAIDASTVIKFQAELDRLKEEGVRRFLLDMEGIRYVNSTGLGSLVKLADGLEREGGVIALMRIHPKVRVVFDMLGLNAFFKIFDNDAAGIAYLRTAGTEEEAPEPELEPEMIEEIAPEPIDVPVAEPVPVAPPVAPPPTPVARAAAAPPVGAVETGCAVCGLLLTVHSVGDYRCPRCFHVLSRKPDGTIENTGRKKAIPVQITLTGHDSCIEGLKQFVEVLAVEKGFKEGDINDLREAITETFHNIIELAYDKNQDLSMQVLLTGVDGEITLRVADHGKVFDMDDRRFASVKKITTEFSHVPHPNGGNIVRLTKKV
ncbi:MAG: anti-sigma factor antagonist [Planctomycetota bacterium]